MQNQESWTPTAADRLPGTGLEDISYKLTDTGNAEKFVAMWGSHVRYDNARNRWLVWDMHRWRPDDDATIWRCAVETVRQRFRDAENDSLSSDYRKALAKWAIQSEFRSRLEGMLRIARTRQPISVSGEGWDATPGIVGAPNGVIDLRTGELRPGRPDDRITMHVGADYDPAAACPRWESFVREIVETAEEADFLKLMLGYALTGEAILDLILIFMGFGGNGKSTLLDFARRAAGDYGREISAQAFLGSRETAHTTEVADLENVRLATCEELGALRCRQSRQNTNVVSEPKHSTDVIWEPELSAEENEALNSYKRKLMRRRAQEELAERRRAPFAVIVLDRRDGSYFLMPASPAPASP